jgi:hypothetical protein
MTCRVLRPLNLYVKQWTIQGPNEPTTVTHVFRITCSRVITQVPCGTYGMKGYCIASLHGNKSPAFRVKIRKLQESNVISTEWRRRDNNPQAGLTNIPSASELGEK